VVVVDDDDVGGADFASTVLAIDWDCSNCATSASLVEIQGTKDCDSRA
jgi:hypothetical protein